MYEKRMGTATDDGPGDMSRGAALFPHGSAAVPVGKCFLESSKFFLHLYDVGVRLVRRREESDAATGRDSI